MKSKLVVEIFIYVSIQYDSSRKIRANIESGSAMVMIVIVC